MSTCIVGGLANRRNNGSSSKEDLWKGHSAWYDRYLHVIVYTSGFCPDIYPIYTPSLPISIHVLTPIISQEVRFILCDTP